jgi:hypothetical protein
VEQVYCLFVHRNNDEGMMMKTKIIVSLTAVMMGFAATSVMAQDGTVTGAAGGAVTGAIVGGPVGAAVGGVVGAVAGTAIDPPPERVVTYVQQQPMPAQPYVVEEQVVVGKPVPRQVVVTPIPDDSHYSYAIINGQRVIVDRERSVVVDVVQ